MAGSMQTRMDPPWCPGPPPSEEGPAGAKPGRGRIAARHPRRGLAGGPLAPPRPQGQTPGRRGWARGPWTRPGGRAGVAGGAQYPGPHALPTYGRTLRPPGQPRAAAVRAVPKHTPAASTGTSRATHGAIQVRRGRPCPPQAVSSHTHHVRPGAAVAATPVSMAGKDPPYPGIASLHQPARAHARPAPHA